jgi:LmbE family N-acetylglucosaminyl deacetylase|tara:strand:- start:159 stop:836 length:678 start_codon:yes stop_codon:yes gene_type:complete
MNILIVAAHPDDEVLGCGGTMARYAEDHEVHVLILGEGLTSRLDDRERTEVEPLEQLRADGTKASQLLGVSSIEFGGLPDNQFDQVPLLQIIKILESKIRTVQPGAIYTHHSGDLNVDHGLTCRAVLTATRPGIGHPVQDVFSCEIRSSTEWAFQQVTPIFRPNVFVDISATIGAKIKAMECYVTESRPSPHPRSPESLRAIAKYWGSVIGCEYAEAFELIRSLR